MKTKNIIIFLLIISLVSFGAILSAQETTQEEEGEKTAGEVVGEVVDSAVETAGEVAETVGEVVEEVVDPVADAKKAAEAEAAKADAETDSETSPESETGKTSSEDEEKGEDEEGTTLSGGFVKARLVCVNGANSYTVILEEQEMVVALNGLDFTEHDFYIFDKKHYQYAEWLLLDYQYIWVDYDKDRVNERGNPLVYLHYGPYETELWEDYPHPGHATAQSPDEEPVKINFFGKKLEDYDHNIKEPYIDDPEFSTVFDNWSPNYDPTKFGKVFFEQFKSRSGKELKRKWFLRDLSAQMLLSGFADIDDKEFSRKEAYSRYVARAKWCRRGLWHTLLKPNPENEDVCGLNKPRN